KPPRDDTRPTYSPAEPGFETLMMVGSSVRVVTPVSTDTLLGCLPRDLSGSYGTFECSRAAAVMT
ncbi:MAG: hypothetical protein WBZ04_06325, partial [Candidatus Nanopelagicales bacterium]